MKKDLILENAHDRDLERLIGHKSKPSEAESLLLKFSSDIGTVRNCGRRGSSFAPTAIINIVKKLALHTSESWSDIEVSDPEMEELSFDQAQTDTMRKLETIFESYPKVKKYIYLGGGHDHIYPALKAINSSRKKIVVINIDAHLDTRTDTFHHSGTPFRQFAHHHIGEFKLLQIGIHDFANTRSSMSELPDTKEVVATFEDICRLTNNFTQNRKVLERMIPYESDALYFFSLDADALDSGIMEGVSAVNHRGLPQLFVEEILVYALDVLKTRHFGFYEYNPIYDNLSQKGARALSSMIYRILDH